MTFDPYAPYGELIAATSIARSRRGTSGVVTARTGSADRQGIEDALVSASAPDIVCLVESWSSTGETTQAAQLVGVERLGLAHHHFVGRLGAGGLGLGQSGWYRAGR